VKGASCRNCQLKLAKVMRVKVGGPGEFTTVASKAEILQKLEERAGPEARKLFEKFTRDLQKLQARSEQDAGHANGNGTLRRHGARTIATRRFFQA
jgi:hypothetical protein